MIQLDFDAPTRARRSRARRSPVGYSQHEGAERAAWDDEKLELVDGTHPVVHPAAGSHANFYDEALFLGRVGREGVGCDDTRGPTLDLRPVVRTIPSDPGAARAAFPWIGFEGRWGELQPAFFNGPTGPNLKTQWTEPIRGPRAGATGASPCPAGARSGPARRTSSAARSPPARTRSAGSGHPLPGSARSPRSSCSSCWSRCASRTTWRPATPFRLARRRAWGQILATSARMYVKRPPLFLGIGLLALPISVR